MEFVDNSGFEQQRIEMRNKVDTGCDAHSNTNNDREPVSSAHALATMKDTSESQKADLKKARHDLKQLSISVLLVDDNSINQLIASKFLRSWGMSVDLADNGKQALEMIQVKKYQLVLMDIMMPVMDGYEATRSIRALKSAYFRDVPILALTASDVSGIRDKIMEAGMNDLIAKPFVPEELHHTILLHVVRSGQNLNVPVEIKLDLDQYAGGDLEFKRKLSQLLIVNLDDLQVALHNTISTNDGSFFQKAYHKSKTAIKMIMNPAFTEVVEEINTLLRLRPSSSPKLLTLENKFWEWSETIKAVVTREMS